VARIEDNCELSAHAEELVDLIEDQGLLVNVVGSYLRVYDARTCCRPHFYHVIKAIRKELDHNPGYDTCVERIEHIVSEWEKDNAEAPKVRPVLSGK
jgi:hypothetical protein